MRAPFTGFDAFLLALEKQYQQRGAIGNVCRYVIDVSGKIDKDELENLLNSRDWAVTLFNTSYQKGNIFRIPCWVQKNPTFIRITQHYSDDLIPESISELELNPAITCVRMDLVQRTDGSSSIILSWNHMIMDGFGAASFLNELFGDGMEKNLKLISYEKPNYSLKSFVKSVKAKYFIDYSSRRPVSILGPRKINLNSGQYIEVLTFNPKQKEQIHKAALACGSYYGTSAFYLTCAARAVKSVLVKRKSKIANFWVPVPRDNRKKGAYGPIIGNRLSFIFYRFKKTDIATIRSGIKEINRQMKYQIKIKMPDAYNHLMNFMKWMPLSIYYFLLKRRSGNSISSFLFTLAPDHPRDLQSLLGKKVSNAFNLPANANPPGLTFAFMNACGKIHLMVLYYENTISKKEFASMALHLEHELITGHEAS